MGNTYSFCRGAWIPNSAVAVALDTELPATTVGILVGTAGNASVTMRGEGTAIVLTGLQAGQIIDGNFKQVNTASTTAGSMTAFYVV